MLFCCHRTAIARVHSFDECIQPQIHASKNSGGLWGLRDPTTLTNSLDLHDYHKCHRSTLPPTSTYGTCGGREHPSGPQEPPLAAMVIKMSFLAKLNNICRPSQTTL